jgi:hypothetical protein
MGVEYRHFLIPSNPTFIPDKTVIKKIDDLMSKWKIKKSNPKIYDLTNGINKEILEPIDAISFEQGIGLKYQGVEGLIVREITGESDFGEDVTDEDRYIMEFIFIAGIDYRIHIGCEQLEITVTKTPTENSNTILPYCDCDDLFYSHSEAYTCTENTLPPEVKFDVREPERVIGGQNFLGYWRTAFIIDYGKDLPKIETFFTLENREFVKDFEDAIGTSIIEIGQVY